MSSSPTDLTCAVAASSRDRLRRPVRRGRSASELVAATVALFVARSRLAIGRHHDPGAATRSSPSQLDAQVTASAGRTGAGDDHGRSPAPAARHPRPRGRDGPPPGSGGGFLLLATVTDGAAPTRQRGPHALGSATASLTTGPGRRRSAAPASGSSRHDRRPRRRAGQLRGCVASPARIDPGGTVVDRAAHRPAARHGRAARAHRRRRSPARPGPGRRRRRPGMVRRTLRPLRRVAATATRVVAAAAGQGRGRPGRAGARRPTPTPAPRSGRSAPRSTGCSTTSATPSTRGTRARCGCASSSPTPATSCAPRSPRSAGTPS